MDLAKEKRQRKEFCNILFELAKDQEALKETTDRVAMYKRLENLYYAPIKEDRFRHFYSDIFTVLTQIQLDPELGDINILGQNLAVIRAGYNPKNHDDGGGLIDISDSIQKLYDHVSLDIARISYADAGDRKISGEAEIISIQSQLKMINADVQKAVKDHAEVEKKLRNQQKEYITILGIFAAVVLAFTGGIAFSTSVLENISAASSYRIITVALIIGLVLLNVLYGLFYFIDRIVNESKNEKSRPLLISNAIIVLLLVCVVIAWFFGAVETRNKRIMQCAISYEINECEQNFGNQISEDNKVTMPHE